MKARVRQNGVIDSVGKKSVTFRSVFIGCILLVILNLINQKADFVGNWRVYLDVAMLP
jgi:hypothetical protein